MDFLIGILNLLIIISSLFLICVILIQRGKGGGLAGAFGGVGGSSAFGTKAGDVFTRITIGGFIVWMITAMLLVVLTNRQASSTSRLFDEPSAEADARGKARPRTGKGAGTGAAAPGATDPLDMPPSPATDGGIGAPPIPAPVDIPAIPADPAKGAGTGKAAGTAPAPAPAPAPATPPSGAPAPAKAPAAGTAPAPAPATPPASATPGKAAATPKSP